jgi:hypothetical protein
MSYNFFYGGESVGSNLPLITTDDIESILSNLNDQEQTGPYDGGYNGVFGGDDSKSDTGSSFTDGIYEGGDKLIVDQKDKDVESDDGLIVDQKDVESDDGLIVDQKDKDVESDDGLIVDQKDVESENDLFSVDKADEKAVEKTESENDLFSDDKADEKAESDDGLIVDLEDKNDESFDIIEPLPIVKQGTIINIGKGDDPPIVIQVTGGGDSVLEILKNLIPEVFPKEYS